MRSEYLTAENVLNSNSGNYLQRPELMKCIKEHAGELLLRKGNGNLMR